MFVSENDSVSLCEDNHVSPERNLRIELTFGSALSICSWDLICLCFSIEKKMKEL